MNTVVAGEELKFGHIGKSVRLQTHSNSIRCQIWGENNENKKYVATRSGYLHVESQMANLSRNGKSESKQKSGKMQVDILPYNSNKYYPQENDTVIGIIVQKNFDFFTVDIGAEGYASLGTLEFQNATRKE